MNHKKKTLALFIIAGFVLMAGVCRAQQGEHADKTLSPYFFVKSDDPTVDQLPLKSTSVKVDVAGVIADVTVTQIYKNEGKQPLEAIYIFPASTRAAVYGMKMTIGERIIAAKIRERGEARREYEQAKQDGKSASLWPISYHQISSRSSSSIPNCWLPQTLPTSLFIRLLSARVTPTSQPQNPSLQTNGLKTPTFMRENHRCIPLTPQSTLLQESRFSK
jgi:hypothetical protein